jgi:hypothetical protein
MPPLRAQPGFRANVRPIFILSLPRTGSTLLQRILGSHEAIATTSEPWFLLPLVYSLRESGVRAEYEHGAMARGTRGFASEYLPGGVPSYLAAVHDFSIRLYSEAAGPKPYFLDKTPRYHHIAADLISLFAEGRFIFLWRHPLAVAASFIETWGAGGWNLDAFSADLFRGLQSLLEAYRANEQKVVSIRYEDLVAQPHTEVDRLLGYLELPLDTTLVDRFPELEMKNRGFWDPHAQRYDGVSHELVDKWKSIMTNPIRKAWCRRYLRWLGADRLASMGYRIEELLAEVNAMPSDMRWLRSDIGHVLAGIRSRRLRAQVLETSFPLWRPR